MALPSTIYRTNIRIADIDRGVYETLQTSVARHPSETEERLVARLLAYSLFYEDDLQFTKGVCVGAEPDLWAKGPDGRVLSWVEVGLPEPDRLIKASRHSERVELLACGGALSHWERHHLPKMEKIANLTVITLDEGFISRLVTYLERTITWEIIAPVGKVARK